MAGAGARARLADARLYLCTDARARQGDLAEFADTVLANGVDIIQLRQKGMEAAHELAALEVLADAATRHGALFAVNDRADLAYASRADVLHLGQDDLPVNDARYLIGSAPLIGRSTHEVGQVDDAIAEDGVDYFCVGPTWPTPTKPGRPAPGPELLRYTARRGTDRPWFAIGGIDFERLPEVLSTGATRIVVVRAITEADDPGAAAAAFAAAVRKA